MSAHTPNGRRRLTTGSASDAVNSLNWLARHKKSSLTPRVRAESMDKKHSVLWRHLCDEALRRQSTAPGERQGADAVLSALLKGMPDYSVSSCPGNVASYKKTSVSLPCGVLDCPHIIDVVGSTGRRYLEEEQNEAGPRRNRGPLRSWQDCRDRLQWPPPHILRTGLNSSLMLHFLVVMPFPIPDNFQPCPLKCFC